MKTGWIIAISVLSSFLAAGLLYLAVSPPRGEAIQILPAPTPIPYIVEVSGAVLHPGVYSFPPGSRVKDALEASGGLSPNADDRNLNQAALLVDGIRIHVPSILTSEGTAEQAPESAQKEGGGDIDVSPGKLININSATRVELESLPGIGPTLAQKIISYRETHGPFSTIESIQDISGIGPAIFERIRDLITVD